MLTAVLMFLGSLIGSMIGIGMVVWWDRNYYKSKE